MKNKMDYTAITAMIISFLIIGLGKKKSPNQVDNGSGSELTFKDNVFTAVNNGFGNLNNKQNVALDGIINAFENYQGIKTVPQFAYIFATAWYESAKLLILKEIRAKQGTALRLKQDKYWFTGWFGRGYVMITFEENYLRLQKITGAPIHTNRELAEHPTVAAQILVVGMMKGAFTGVGLPRYVHESKIDFFNARRVVNILDRAELIKSYAETFLDNYKTLA